MRLSRGELKNDRQTVGVHERVDLRRQSAARAPHASACREVPSGGLRLVGAPFLPFAPCWCTRLEEESIICRSPSSAAEIEAKIPSQTPSLRHLTKRL